MDFKLSKLELRALSVLCSGGLPAGELAVRLGASKSLVSRVVASLGNKGLVDLERQGTRKLVSLSPRQHAQAFKRLRESRPQASLEDWLSGWALDVLVVMGWGNGASMERLVRECSCSKNTIGRIITALSGVGIVARRGGAWMVYDSLADDFANAFADYARQEMQSSLDGHFTVLKRVRKHVVIRTDSKRIPGSFVLTGLAFFIEQGLEVIRADYSDYYFNLCSAAPVLSPEERFIHALLISTIIPVNKPLLAVVFRRWHFKLRELKRLAEEYAAYGEISKELEQIRVAMDYHEKLRDYK